MRAINRLNRYLWPDKTPSTLPGPLLKPINAVRIAWAEPYARHYLVQYWAGDDPLKQPARGTGVTVPGGSITNGAGGRVTLQLAPTPMPVRFLRIWMTASSNTCDSHAL